MEIQVLRKWPRDNYIIGQMLINGKFFCHTMEPPHKGAHPCIPVGTYNVEMYPSAKFRGMRPIIKDVKGRSGILIHEGNFPKDTQGCILVGRNTAVGQLAYSRNTLNALIAYVKDNANVTITIKEVF